MTDSAHNIPNDYLHAAAHANSNVHLNGKQCVGSLEYGIHLIAALNKMKHIFIHLFTISMNLDVQFWLT